MCETCLAPIKCKIHDEGSSSQNQLSVTYIMEHSNVFSQIFNINGSEWCYSLYTCLLKTLLSPGNKSVWLFNVEYLNLMLSDL